MSQADDDKPLEAPKRRRRNSPRVEKLVDEPDESPSEKQPSDDSEANGFSLDDLSAVYAQALAEHDPQGFAAATGASDEPSNEQAEADALDPVDVDASSQDDEAEFVTPIGIVEAALFIGQPDGQPQSEHRLASLMRDVTAEEIVELIDELNRSYREQGQALRIVREEGGYRMTLSPDTESIRRSFYGKVRDARLNQSAVEVLALVAYQPGITGQKVQDQRGRESGSVLNQLVRRRLLEMRREPDGDDPKLVPHYYPTERFLFLFGLESLDDLPRVEETFHG